jgi:NAD(P)H-dependent FMN reductase
MTTLHVAVLMGSAREGRLCDKVTRWVTERLKTQPDLTFDVIDPAAFEVHHWRLSDAAAADLRRRLGQADAFVVVTPEYNHAYPAALKLLIDTVKAEWRAKPVALVSYGGLSGGLRAIEQLRLVFAELHAVTLRDTVSFVNAWGRFDAEGALRDPADAEAAMDRVVSLLCWWGHALRYARDDVPYGEARQPVHASVPEGHEGPVVLINTFTPKPGKLDAFVAAQLDDLRAFAGEVPGMLGARFHRALDGHNAVGVAVFASAADHRRWLEQARFAGHLQKIAPLLDRADPRLYAVAFEAGSLQLGRPKEPPGPAGAE